MKPNRTFTTALALVATLLLTGVICWLTLTPQAFQTPPSALPLDKVAHALAFGALIAPSAVLRPRYLWWTLPAAAALGFGIELIQPWVGRSREWADAGADLVGLALGTVFGLMLRRFLKSRVFPDLPAD